MRLTIRKVVLSLALHGSVAIRCSNCGKGQWMWHPPGRYHHIFKRFIDRFQKIQGIGLGLPLAKAVIEAHGGAIR
ncbi:MAG: hypothetical protein ACLUB0_11610 [Blautia hansenii]